MLASIRKKDSCRLSGNTWSRPVERRSVDSRPMRPMQVQRGPWPCSRHPRSGIVWNGSGPTNNAQTNVDSLQMIQRHSFKSNCIPESESVFLLGVDPVAAQSLLVLLSPEKTREVLHLRRSRGAGQPLRNGGAWQKARFSTGCAPVETGSGAKFHK